MFRIMSFCRTILINKGIDIKICLFVDKTAITSIMESSGGNGAAFTEPVVATGRSRAFRLSRELVRRSQYVLVTQYLIT